LQLREFDKKMNKLFNTFVVYGLLYTSAILGGGCTKQNERNPDNDIRYVLDFVESRPTSPAVLKKGQKLHVGAYYTIRLKEMAYIWARPYREGQRLSGYQAHPLIPVGGHNPAEGMIEMWFLFEEPTSIDEIRIMMKERDSDTIIKTISQPVDIKWQ
jgi:hypothetical protein